MQHKKKPVRLSVPISPEALAEIQREARHGRLSIAKTAQQVLERGLAVIRRSELERALREGYLGLATEDGSLAEEMLPLASWDD